MHDLIKSLFLLIVLTGLLSGCASQTAEFLPELPDPPHIVQEMALPADRPVQPPSERSLDLPEYADLLWLPPVRDQKWRFIVIHHSGGQGGNAEKFDAFHRSRGWDELGYHFVITNGQDGPDGAVEVGSRWKKQKWGAHAGGTQNNQYNNYGVGICLVGNFSERLPSEAQLQSLDRLCRFLMARYGIPPAAVIGHRDASGNATDCPGNALHHHIWSSLRNELAGN